MDGQVKVSRVLHAGYLFECEGTKILFDPIFENPFSRNCYAYPPIEFNLEKIKKFQVDAIFISHYHDDHCSFDSLNLLDKKTPIYLFCKFPELFSLIRELGFTNVFSIVLNQTITLAPFEIIPRRALDHEVDSIYHLKVQGLNILNVVDSWIDEETFSILEQTKSWDLVLWPFQTMRELEVISPKRLSKNPVEIPPEWLSQLKNLKPRFLVPSSCQFIHEAWSWYRKSYFPITYKMFSQKITELLPETKVLRLNPGVSINLSLEDLNYSDPLSFIVPKGDQEVDYQFDASIKAPPTSEIAKNFSALSSEEIKFVHHFCLDILAKKYKELGGSDEVFFAKTRSWRLSLYDHEGEVQHFFYEISQENLRAIKEKPKKLSWSTELPLFKLYSALKTGESLSSLYVRINDEEFCPEVETELAEVDFLSDPLLFCLFSEAFGSYQRAQLEKIIQSR